MAKFENINFEAFGEYVRDMLADPDERAIFETGSQEQIKDILSGFMTPINHEWADLTIVPHFDGPTTVNISFPHSGDVNATVERIAPASGPGEDYDLPSYYSTNPNQGSTEAEVKQNRLRAYHSRIGDYVMSRCK